MTDLVVIRETQTLVITAPGPMGPPGPEGPQGPPGAGGMYFRHDQHTASASVIVTHNLGVVPNVSILNPDGEAVYAPIEHSSVNQFTITFPTPWIGSVICS